MTAPSSPSPSAPRQRPRVVVVGGGFGGLNAVRALRRADVEITLVDRNNYHLFQPLLYQVATGVLSPANIAAPLRHVVRRQGNVTVLQAEATGFDLAQKQVLHAGGAIPYDYLIVAAGATHSHFGHDEWEALAPGLKTIEDATEIRARVLSAFERAEITDDEELRRRLMTFVIVGGGPTGVELAGALSELSRHTLHREFRRIRPEDARLILVDAAPRVLGVYPPKLSERAARDLARLGVTVREESLVTEITPTSVTIKGPRQTEVVPTETVLWAAGVKASPLARMLGEASGATIDRAGRIAVSSTLSLADHPEVFVIGDMASVADEAGKPLPGVAPVAVQQGKHVSRGIKLLLAGKQPQPFHYHDHGSMATIGRSAAVVHVGRLQFGGLPAWLAWLFLHLMLLVSFERRLLVFTQWVWSYVTHGRSSRLITGRRPSE